MQNLATEYYLVNFFDYSPVRVDFAGGWLDTPGKHRTGGYVVNCAVSPFVSKDKWIYSQQSGLGGSSAWAYINKINPFQFDMEHGNGWQDSAIILETGCCVWHSGDVPALDFKNTGDFLRGKMALYNTNIPHDTALLSEKQRDIERIKEASKIARTGVKENDIKTVAQAVRLTYELQLKEGMAPLPHQDLQGFLGCKYCGSGHGGYALYLFETPADRDKAVQHEKDFLSIEPYCRLFNLLEKK